MKKLKPKIVTGIIAGLIFLSCFNTSYAKTAGKTSFAVGPEGDVFLLIPSLEQKIHRINQRGVIVERFGEEGPGEGQLIAPIDMLIWKDTIYVLDLFGPQIKKLTLKGKSLGTIGKDLEEEQKLKKPIMIRIHHDKDKEQDLLYVLDTEKRQIIVFTLDGKLTNSVSLAEEYESNFDWMTSFNIDENGSYWITTDSLEDIALRHVWIFHKDGLFLGEFSMHKVSRGGFLTDIIPLPEGEFILVDSAASGPPSSYSGSMIFCDATGEQSIRRTIFHEKTSRYYSPVRVKIASDGYYVLTSEDLLLQMNKNFEIIHTWSLQ